MILEKQTNNLIMEEGDSKGSIGMSLDLDSANVLMQMLSKNLYSDAIGSTIRESVSNSLDSHRKCNVDKPIIVKLERNDGGNYEFSTEDFGCGLDDVDVKEIISKYGKSTKRDDSNQLGMMGLGFKAPLAYSSSFYFICRKNGIERKYMMYEGEDENTIDLLFEKPTTEGNGVKIIISVDYYDRDSFFKKIKEQLAYFENVYFDGVTNGYEYVKNDFTIFRGEDFQYSELCTDKNMHLCLDNVYYPIDFSKLGIDKPIAFPIALKFSLTDGIFPVPSRESIRYTKEAKETILNKIKLVSEYFINKFNEGIKETDDVYSIFDYYNSSVRQVDIINEGATGTRIMANCAILEPYSTIKIEAPTLTGIEKFPLELIRELNDYALREYSTHLLLTKGRIRAVKHKHNMSIREFRDGTTYIYSEVLGGIKKEYVKSLHPSSYNNIYFLRKDKEFKLGSLKSGYNADTYISMLKLGNHPKSEWRQIIKEYQYIISLITNKFVNLDVLEIPEQYIEDRKQKRISLGIIKERRKKLKGEIVGKTCVPLERDVQGKYSKLVPIVQNMEEMYKNNYISVYGTTETLLMDKLFSIFKPKNIKFISFSEREIKKMSEVELHNWIEINKFMKGDNILFKRAVTAYLISEMMSKNRNIFYKLHVINKISSNLYNKLEELVDYKDKWYISGSSELYEIMLTTAKENNLFDENIISLYREMDSLLNKLKFINPLLGGIGSYGGIKEEALIDAISDLFKYYKQKLNLDRYKSILEEPITEELIEELTN